MSAAQQPRGRTPGFFVGPRVNSSAVEYLPTCAFWLEWGVRGVLDHRDAGAGARRGPGGAGEGAAGCYQGGERPRGGVRRAGRRLVGELRRGSRGGTTHGAGLPEEAGAIRGDRPSQGGRGQGAQDQEPPDVRAPGRETTLSVGGGGRRVRRFAGCRQGR